MTKKRDDDYTAMIIRYIDIYKPEYLHESISKVAAGTNKIICLDYSDIDSYNHDLASGLLTQPNTLFGLFQKAIDDNISKLYHDSSNYGYFISIKDVPNHTIRRVTALSAKDRYRLIRLHGTVRLVKSSRPKIIIAKFQCPRPNCGSIYNSVVGIDNKISYPILDCHPKAKPILLPTRSVFIDAQFVDIQDDFVNPGGMQQIIHVLLTGPLVNTLTAGSKVEITGIPHLEIHEQADSINAYCDMFFYTRNIKQREQILGDIEITPDDECKILEYGQNPNILQILAGSIAPSIKGYEVIKTALILQQIQGTTRFKKDGTRVRGNIHGLLAGEPGLAKTKFLLYISSLLKGIYATAKTSSGAGLTATVKQEKGPDGIGQWTLTAGALPLADQGTCSIDELDKMAQDVTDSLLCAMENGSFPFNKADVSTTLFARCNILGACNPKERRYNYDLSLAENLELKPDFLSRFDFIFHIIDKMDLVRDEDIALHIINLHTDDDDDVFQGLMDIDMLRKYIVYSQKIKPGIPGPTKRYIKKTYIEFRKKSDPATRSISITPRQLESIIRLSTASAKAHLRDQVRKSDVDIAVMIFEEYMASVSGSMPGETFSIDSIVTDISPVKKRCIDSIVSLLKDRDGKPLSQHQIFRVLKSKDTNLKNEDIDQAITWCIWNYDPIRVYRDDEKDKSMIVMDKKKR